MQIEELRKLPLEEKLRIVEELWDDIGSSHAATPVPEWVTTEARRRAKEIQGDTDSLLTRAEVWKAVDARDCSNLPRRHGESNARQP